MQLSACREQKKETSKRTSFSLYDRKWKMVITLREVEKAGEVWLLSKKR